MSLQINELKQGKFVFDGQFAWYTLQSALSSAASLTPFLERTNTNSFFSLNPRQQAWAAECLMHKSKTYIPFIAPNKKSSADKAQAVAELLNISPNSARFAIEMGEINPDDVIDAYGGS